MPARLHFTLATPVDANAIFDLVYKDPKPFLKSATLSDVQDWITNGSCWIVRDIGGAGIIGACNIRVPETNRYDEPEPAEFGGIFIHPEYRVRGISDALGVLTQHRTSGITILRVQTPFRSFPMFMFRIQIP